MEWFFKTPNIMKSIYLSVIFLFLSIFIQAQIVNEYDFNSLSEGDLNGQDNWQTILHTSGPHDFTISYSVGSVASPDGTLAIFYNGSGGGYGRTATRKTSSNFDFDLTQADIIEVEIDMHRNWWGMFFGVGFDADGDGHIAPGLASEPDDGGIYFTISSYEPETHNKVVLPSGEEVIYNVDNSGWCRYKLVMDFTANDGEGAVALMFDPGVTGEWVAIPEIQGVNMGLTPGSGDMKDRSVWDGVFFHAQGGTAAYDNIKITQSASNGESQYIDFATIDNMLTTHESFELEATATSNLPVVFEVTDGPATLDGNTLSLTGEAGMVTITANQAGDDIWAPAQEVTQTFEVVDATAYTADLTIRRPADYDNSRVYMTELNAILIVASAYIEHPEVLHIDKVSYTIEGANEVMTEKSWGTGYYSSEWTPSDYGTYTMTITAETTGGMSSVQTVTFEVTDEIADVNVQTFDQVHISTSTQTTVIDNFAFPTYVGSFDQIIAYLDVTCPSGGCDAWDRVGHMYAKAPNGEWVEIIRYITPYGVACDHNIEVTDYSSIFQGLVEMRFSIGTDSHGFVVDVNFDFQEGTPPYKYSWVKTLWNKTYPFGDYDNLQPVEPLVWNFESITEVAKLKIFNTGHGWGPSNSQNAAEFYEATHKIKVNDTDFDQHLWVDCNPNPDGCQPQNGTWYYDRAGWCPGSIGAMYEYNLTPFINESNANISYEFYPGYVDYCHPNHPECVSGVTCDNCNEGFNPHYIVSAYMVSFGDDLFIPTGEIQEDYFGMQLFPNPSRYSVQLTSNKQNHYIDANVEIYTIGGRLVNVFTWDGEAKNIDISQFAEGVYIVSISSEKYREVKRLLVE